MLVSHKGQKAFANLWEAALLWGVALSDERRQSSQMGELALIDCRVPD